MELQVVSVEVVGAGAVLALFGMLVFLALMGHWIDPSRYPIVSL